MISFRQRITVMRFSAPARKSLNDDLQWLASSLGLFSIRDKERSLFRIFIELIKAAKHKKPISSDELANKLSLSRGTVIHHINNLIEKGLVISERKRYMLRVEKLSTLVNELERDTQRIFEDMKRIAKDIDRQLGM